MLFKYSVKSKNSLIYGGEENLEKWLVLLSYPVVIMYSLGKVLMHGDNR